MMLFPSVGFRGFRGSSSFRRTVRLLPLCLVSAFIFAVALSMIASTSSSHHIPALGSGPAARTKAIALNSSTATVLRYSTTFTHLSGLCRVETPSVNVFIVDAGATTTSQGEGPYTSSSGPFAVGGLDSAIASAVATLRCRFYDAPISGLSTGGGGGVAAELVCMLGGPCTMTSAITFSGVTTDITTGTNEDLTLDPNGTGKIAVGTNNVDFNGTNVSGLGGGVIYTPGVLRADTGFHILGTAMSLNSLGMQCLTNSFGCGIRQTQTAVATHTAFISGNADAAGEIGVRSGTQVTDAAGGDVATLHSFVTDEDGTPVEKLTVKGKGQIQQLGEVSAAGTLSASEACAALGDVGKYVRYSDTVSVKRSICICEQTGSGAFAWGAATTTGDCT